MSTPISLRLDANLTIPLTDLDLTAPELVALKKFCQSELNFFNPKIIELQRMGFSIWKVPKYINNFKENKASWVLPAGFLPTLLEYGEQQGLDFKIDDRQTVRPIEPPPHHIQPRPEQTEVLTKILAQDRAILEAKPGFGKTMAALLVFAARGQKTLIIVHTRTLLSQWRQRLTDYFDLVKGDLGLIGEGKWQVGDKITIASYQTLLSRGTKSIQDEFGQIIVDECHHVPAQTFTKVARGFSAKYYLGLSATPFRKDKLDRLMTFYLGPIIPSGEAPELAAPQDKLLTESTARPENVLAPEKTHLVLRATKFYVENPDLIEFTQLGSLLIEDAARNALIIRDVAAGLARHGHCLILTERVHHVALLAELIRQTFPKVKVATLNGQMKKADREALYPEIKQNKYQVLIATGSIIGEGFDWPDIDHLYLVYPFSWKGKLIQYVGRAQRLAPGKEEAWVYDYLDLSVSMLRAMGRRRARAYRDLEIRLPAVSDGSEPAESAS